ncbi:uncharacterized protein LOC129763458 [Toxorhynchites rutilus septentrionalis]|uniref:uncharacterized protein LOC129763458 n=1 Tax=Toxorhynchites rutilus septentrionalis TaxID=329112 RepID=UPI00247B22B5|nr:uncharacterized protein LOC129763458 [Toxorhynchites rutilus septentrionalis]
MLILVILLVSACYGNPPTSYESKDAHGVSHSSHVKHVQQSAGSWSPQQKPNGPTPPCTKHKIRHVPWSHLLPVILQPNGAVIDTPEVELAKAAHLAEHAKIKSRLHKRSIHAPSTWHGPIHIPVIKNGVPVETPEVRHAKAVHAAAHASTHASGVHSGLHGGNREARYLAEIYSTPEDSWYGRHQQRVVPFEQAALAYPEDQWRGLYHVPASLYHANDSPHGYSIGVSHVSPDIYAWY